MYKDKYYMVQAALRMIRESERYVPLAKAIDKKHLV